jgi:hypothetical protein
MMIIIVIVMMIKKLAQSVSVNKRHDRVSQAVSLAQGVVNVKSQVKQNNLPQAKNTEFRQKSSLMSGAWSNPSKRGAVARSTQPPS